MSVKNHFKNLSRISKQEISFSNAENSLVNQLFTFDHYATDLQMFTVYGSNIGVKSDLLSEALRNLTKKNAGLLYFIILWIWEMSRWNLNIPNPSKSFYINVLGIVIWIKMYEKGLKLMLLEPIWTKLIDVSWIQLLFTKFLL